MAESRKVAAILVADIVGYSRLTGADEEGTLARLRALRSDLIDPAIAVHNGRLVKRTGDGAIVEFRSVVEAVRCAIEVRNGFAERNAGLPDDRRFEARVGIHLGDVVEEADGDLMGDGVNIAARLEGICESGAIVLSEDAYRQVRDKINETLVDLGEQNLKNIARPMRVYALTAPTGARPASPSATVVPKSLDWRERRSALTPILENIVIPNIVGKSRSRRERRQAVATTVSAILQNIARLKGAVDEKATTRERPVAGSSSVVPTVDEKATTKERPVIGSSGAIPTVDQRSQRRRFIRFLIVVGIFAILATRAWRGQEPFAPSHSPAPLPAALEDKLAKAPRLSIAVLPFANLSGDPEQDYFADGLTDDLTTDLSHLPGSFVIAHSTASTYKGKAVDAKQVGRELGVRYAVEGSVRRVSETITVNAQLISTETGAHVWADRFEGERSKLGELQVEAVARIANALGVQLVQAESLRALRERPTNPDGVDLSMRGWAALSAGLSPENANKAIGYFDQALQLDPDSPEASIGKALAQLIKVLGFGIGDRREVLQDAEQAADRVLSLQPNNARALYAKALVSSGRGQFEATLAELDAIIAIDRNYASAYAEKGHTLVMLGRAEEAIKPVEEALRLDPRNAGRNIWEWYMCDAYAHLAQWEKAIEWCEKSIAPNPSLPLLCYVELTAANSWPGRPAEARAAAAELQKLKPGFAVQDYLALPHPDNAKWK
ncbi:MAG TPA: adenylate/guanylate cyclase domain-containing protein, partial [Roseiarcus sp.]|nr:adenylate/guanylate cyclase domain-containing protein [Roseiarcus sp.]